MPRQHIHGVCVNRVSQSVLKSLKDAMLRDINPVCCPQSAFRFVDIQGISVICLAASQLVPSTSVVLYAMSTSAWRHGRRAIGSLLASYYCSCSRAKKKQKFQHSVSSCGTRHTPGGEPATAG